MSAPRGRRVTNWDVAVSNSGPIATGPIFSRRTLWRRPGTTSLWLAHAGFAALAFALAACTASPPLLGPQATALAPAKQADVTADMSPPVLREHQRILGAYGGVYNDPKLQAMLERTVEKLVAASDRPDLHYKVTMLNSQSINGFALPTGQLYVARGLVALANDESELASVLAHEMGHVVARHAAIREEQAKQAALVGRVVSDVISDPEIGALALAKSKLALASFSRSQEFEADAIGIGIASRAGYDPYGAVRFLTSMEHNSELKPQQTAAAIDPRAPDFLSSHPATPERISNAVANARQYSGGPTTTGSIGVGDKTAYLGDIDGIVFGEDPSEGFVRGRQFLHPRLGFTFTAPQGFNLENSAQAVLGVNMATTRAGGARRQAWRRPGAAARCGAGAGRANACGLPNLELDRGYRTEHAGGCLGQRLSGRYRGGERRSMGFPALCHPVRQRRLSLHLRHQA